MYQDVVEQFGLNNPKLRSTAEDRCNAAATGNVSKLRQLAGQGLNIDHGDYDKRTAMHLAASEGLLQVVQVLVDELGANPSVVDRWGGTPACWTMPCAPVTQRSPRFSNRGMPPVG